MKVLKWFLLIPPAVFPYFAVFFYRPGPPPGPEERAAASVMGIPPLFLWIGLVYGCALLIFLTRNRWTAKELSLAIMIVKLVQIPVIFICCYLIFLILPAFYLILPVVFSISPLYYLFFLPTCLIGVSAVLRCRKEGLLSQKQVGKYLFLQFIFVADFFNAYTLSEKSKEVTP